MKTYNFTQYNYNKPTTWHYCKINTKLINSITIFIN